LIIKNACVRIFPIKSLLRSNIMDKKEILDFISKNPTCFLATVEGNKPHVRAIGTFRADENGIIYAMQSYKDVYKQSRTLKSKPAIGQTAYS
jgi:uncharacterized pyridoxamine 5'-phosphate oxidase family protein